MPAPNFLITSTGRTATKWLAAQMGVAHEPERFDRRAVSPRHLWLWTHEGWRPPSPVAYGVVIRDPVEQLRSVKRRAKALGSPGRVQVYKDNMTTYLGALGHMTRNLGAVVLRYEEMTTDPTYLERIAEHFGCELTGRFKERLNVFEGRESAITDAEVTFCSNIRKVYEAWHQTHGM